MITKFFDKLPHGCAERRLIAWITIGQGIGYFAVYFFAKTLTTSYARQALIMPLWAWGTVLVILGVAVLGTSWHYRRAWIGRLSALALVAFLSWLIGTFWTTGAYTTTGQYIPILLLMMGEATFVNDRWRP